jgi:Fic family protein
MNYGLARLSELPLSLNLIREIHSVLMHGVRGQHRDPGEFRRIQNWIGPEGSSLANATFVPPPPQTLMVHMGALETYMHEDAGPALIRAGLAHAQFETIHPFLDGNGRIGRLLITFMLCREGVLHRPLLYLSYYLKRSRSEYYDRLQAIRLHGHWEEWLDFFFRGVAETADEAWRTAQSILLLQRRNRELLQRQKASINALRVHELLWRYPIVTIAFLQRELHLTFQGASGVVQRLVEIGVLEESTGYRRNRRFVYSEYLKLFDETTSQTDVANEVGSEA